MRFTITISPTDNPMNLQEDIDRIKEVMEQTSLELKGKTIASKYDPPANFGQSKGVIDSKTSINPDFIIDAISAAIDTIPGVGNVVSFVVDELHGISYFVRAAMTSGLERTEFILLGLVTSALGFIPVGGNIASVGIKQGIKNVLKLTPDAIQKWAISKGIIKYRILLNTKKGWNYPWWLFMLKLSKTMGVDVLVKQIGKLRQTLINIKSKLQKENLLILGLDDVFDTAISWLETPTSEELAVMEEMVDKGII